MKGNWDCEICASPDCGGGIGGWSVNTELWENTMLEDAKLKICISCFEQRLGRKLNTNDFTGSLDNESNKNVQDIFKSEGKKFRTETIIYHLDTGVTERVWDE